MLILYVQISMDKYKHADYRYSHCPYRDIIGCNNFMCVDCSDEKERYLTYLEYERRRLYWQKLKTYEKNYPFPETINTCPY